MLIPFVLGAAVVGGIALASKKPAATGTGTVQDSKDAAPSENAEAGGRTDATIAEPQTTTDGTSGASAIDGHMATFTAPSGESPDAPPVTVVTTMEGGQQTAPTSAGTNPSQATHLTAHAPENPEPPPAPLAGQAPSLLLTYYGSETGLTKMDVNRAYSQMMTPMGLVI